MVHCILFFQKFTITPCFVLLQVKAVLPSSGLFFGLERVANAPGAMVTWLDTRHTDDNAYTIDRSSSEL